MRFPRADYYIEPYTIEQINNLPGGRRYSINNGESYPSITSVLGILGEEGLAEWRARVGEKEAERIGRQAARRGTAVHDCIETFLDGFDPKPDNPLIEIMFKQISYVLEDRLTEIYAVEKQLYSDHLRMAGTVDLIGVFDGKLSVIDFKTSTKEKIRDWCESYFCQEAGYSIMWEERTKMPITQLVTIIVTEESTTLEPQVFIEHRDDWAPKLIQTRKTWAQRYE